MKKLTKTAQAAKDAAEQRRIDAAVAEAIRRFSDEHSWQLKTEKENHQMLKEYHSSFVSRYTRLIGELREESDIKDIRISTLKWAAYVLAAILGVVLAAWVSSRSEWSSGTPKTFERVDVETEGYMDEDGKWRSFDTGEPITVHRWKEHETE